MKVKGELKKVFTREVRGTTYYSVCVGGADSDGSDLWASCNKNKPSCAEGDTVEFDAIKDGKYWQVEAADIKVASKGGPTPVASKGGWNDPDRQKSIVAQSSIKMAMEFIDLALRNEALVLATKSASVPKKFDALNAVLAEKAKEFYFTALDPDTFFGDAPVAEEEEEEFNPIGE
jgi:hypothetical protein